MSDFEQPAEWLIIREIIVGSSVAFPENHVKLIGGEGSNT